MAGRVLRMLMGLACVALPAATQEPPDSAQAGADSAEAAPPPGTVTPLFASDEMLTAFLQAPFEDVFRYRSGSDRTEYAATLSVADPVAGKMETFEVQVRVRGHFRALESTCAFPNIRLNFKKKAVEGTLFDGQDRLRLVTHCQGTRDYEEHVLQEYLAYRAYNQLTDLSLRVRLVRMTYVDTQRSSGQQVTKYAFFIEPYEAAGIRMGWDELELETVVPFDLDQRQLSIYELFQYMIANTDWSVAFPKLGERYCCHNALLFGNMAGPVFPLPYDFDWSGVIDASYAVPDEKIGIRSVRQRKFWGICRGRETLEEVIPLFNERREAIYDLYRTQIGLSRREKERTLDYLDEFYEVINDEEKFTREIVEQCRPVGG